MHTGTHTLARSNTSPFRFCEFFFFREAVLDTWQALHRPISWSWPIAQWRITAEEDMLDKRKQEREIRNSSPYDEELWPTSE